MTRALVPMAPGVEEIEAVAVVDLLRRAGWSVTVASVGGQKYVKGSRDVVFACDCDWSDITPEDFDVLVLPGGAGGTDILNKTPGVLSAVRKMHEAGRLVGAICAAPTVLFSAGILKGRKVACHPAVENRMPGAVVLKEPVCRDGNIVTGRGAGTAIEFALEIIRARGENDKADAIAKAIVYPGLSNGF